MKIKEGTVNFDQYSGYITVDSTNGRALFYYFVESQNDPANDPVTLWLNGGPGCSSLDGFFYEHGPFHFDRSAFGKNDSLYLNEWAWNKVSNVIYLEAPAGVGYSYSNTSTDYNTNDNKTAEDNYQFLLNFFESYPEFATNDFYIAGESYAGIYVPTLAYLVHEKNLAGNNPKINLKGILVGNGVTDETFDGVSYLQFAYNHALYSPNLYSKLLAGGCLVANAPPSCDKLLIQMYNDIGNVNQYDIYGTCYQGPFFEYNYHPLLKGVGESPPCINSLALTEYTNSPAVRAALHALPASQIGPWMICSDKVHYKKLYPSVLYAYQTLTQNYRVLVYSGDTDGAVPYVGTIEWIQTLQGDSTPVADWVAWELETQLAGYYTVYDAPYPLNFVTVKGAGHMVPQYKPPQAYKMYSGFLAGTFPPNSAPKN